MPGSDEDGKDAAGESYEQGMKARGVVNFGFWNANGKEECIERKQGEKDRKNKNARGPKREFAGVRAAEFREAKNQATKGECCEERNRTDRQVLHFFHAAKDFPKDPDDRE